MNRSTMLIAIIAIATLTAYAQDPATEPAPASAQKTLAATLNIYAFPQKGQSAAQQSQAESACYSWAVETTHTDPFQLQKQAQQQAQQTEANKQQAAKTGEGTVGRTMVRGAAVGTLIGGISGNEGKGAAYGAAAGLLVGSARRSGAQQQAVAQAEAQGQQAQQATAAQAENFKKAFSVCLEGKGYLVK